MTIADLNFSQLIGIVDPQHVDLEFVQSGAVSKTAVLVAVVPAPVLSVGLSANARQAALNAVIAKPVLSVVASYDNAVSRPVASVLANRYQQAVASTQQSVTPYQQAKNDRTAWQGMHQDAIAVSRAITLVDQQAKSIKVADGSRYQVADRVDALHSGAFADLLRRPDLVGVRYQVADRVDSAAVGFEYVQLLPKPRLTDADWQVANRLNGVLMRLLHQIGIHLNDVELLRYQVAMQPPYGKSPELLPPEPDPYQPTTNLDFVCESGRVSALSINLNFSHGLSCPVVQRRSYVIMNDVLLTRVSDGAPIEIKSVQVGTDKDSWCWSFSATIAYYELSKVDPSASGPVEVELTINGQTWRLMVESYTQKEQFAQSDFSIRGRSTTALLADPYSATRSYTHNDASVARQLADNELERGSAPSGFTIDWQLIDDLGWSVPAKTLNYDNLSPLQAVQKIAAGGGGYVQSHPNQPVLLVLPEYPAPSWDWATATPAKTINADLIKSVSLDWSQKPDYNGVYVSGVVSGVTAFVRRTGTDGALQAPMSVDRMTCDYQAARQKGISILSAAGKQATVSIDVPMHNSIGLALPSMLIDVGGQYRAMVRSVSISATKQNGLTVTQTIGMERHY